MENKKKYAVLKQECVACGCCMKTCPRDAIRVFKGLYAEIDETKCIRCGICMKTCPASVIIKQEIIQ